MGHRITLVVVALRFLATNARSEVQLDFCSQNDCWRPWGIANHIPQLCGYICDFGVDECLPGQAAGYLVPAFQLHYGYRYRLQVDMRTDEPGLAVRAGLVSIASGLPEDAVWTETITSVSWFLASVEVEAVDDMMTLILERQNSSGDQALSGANWRAVKFLEVGDTPRATPTPGAEDPLPPPNDTFGCLENLWTLAEPKTGIHARLVSSPDRGHIRNSDSDHYKDVLEENGETWRVLKALDGPGAITRLWMDKTHPDGRIRLDIDGTRVHDEPVFEFFGTNGQVSWPLAEETNEALVSYMPMPFGESARVMIAEPSKTTLPWQISYHVFDATDGVRPYTNPLNETDARYLQRLRRQWSALGRNPKPRLPGTREDVRILPLTVDGYTTLWSAEGAGVVDSFSIENIMGSAEFSVCVDGESEPSAVMRDAFLSQLSPSSGQIQFSLLLGSTGYCSQGVSGSYSHFPIPFSQDARIEVNSGITPLTLRVRWTPCAPSQFGPLRFKSTHTRRVEDASGAYYRLFDLKGTGHLAGTSYYSSYILPPGGLPFQFGDEDFRVDGNETLRGASVHNYFGLHNSVQWQNYASKVQGEPLGQSNECHGYRFHVPDFIPFDESLQMDFEMELELDIYSSPLQKWYGGTAFFYILPVEVTKPSWRVR